MKTVECPSESIPGPVPIAIAIPEEWTVGPAPLVSFAAVAPSEVAGVLTNAVGVVRRVGDSLELDEMREMVASDLGAIEGSALIEEDFLDLDGLPGLLRVTELSLPGGSGPFRLLQVAALAKLGGGVADVVTLTITVSSTAPEDHVELCRQIAGSLRVGVAT